MGTNLLTRRQLITVGLKGLGLLSLGSSMPLFVPRLARAQQLVGTTRPADNILVVLQLSGGNDGLNTVVPVGDDAYRKARPRLALKDKLHKLDDHFSLNPGLTAFKRMYDDGRLAIIHSCGYPKPNRSHFESMSIWHTADPENNRTEGWLGHYVDHLKRGTSAGSLHAINVGSGLPQALVNSDAPVPSVNNIADFQVKLDPDSAFDQKLERELILKLQTFDHTTPAEHFLARQATNAIASAEEIQRLTAGYSPDATYPRGLGDRLRLVAQLISAGLGTRVLYVETGGFDTHANQLQQHQALLRGVGDAVEAFFTDLHAKGLDSHVTLICFSEFGRRVKENASAGTDHGAAGPVFLAGPKVRPGLHGTFGTFDRLDAGDIPHTTDFRRVYATLLKRWLNADPAAVLGQAFDPIDCM
jgi:uncharacterized protein (DUF1501 family)